MYLRKIVIKDVKSFSNLELDFTNTQGEIACWTTLFGQNGLGKSTLLQAIGIALAGPAAVRELIPVAEHWVRRNSAYAEIMAEIMWEKDDQLPETQPRRAKPLIARYIITGENPELLPDSLTEQNYYTVPTVVAWSGDGDTKSKEAASKDLRTLQKTAYAENKQGWLACGYGPFRRLSGGGQDADRILYAERISARFITLFREDAALTNATDWLVKLHNTAREGDKSSENALKRIRQVFSSNLFPETTQLLVDARSARLQVNGQEPISLQHLSDGYRSMLALTIDLLRWLLKAFPDAPDPTKCSGVVLIDELDAHLHPKWQRQIGHWLRQKFPNIQFIVATHSPFLAQVADVDKPGMQANRLPSTSNNTIYLKETEAGVVACDDIGAMQDLRVDQILQSALFDMDNLYSPITESKLKKHDELNIKKHSGVPFSAIEEREYQSLDLWREHLPMMTSLEDQALEKALENILQSHRNQLQEVR